MSIASRHARRRAEVRETFDVVVVGGGIAGLATAYDLASAGRHVCVLEAGPRSGGVMQTERMDGWVVDRGPDSFLVQKPAALTLCTELGLQAQLVSTLPPRTAFVLRDGRLHPLPEGSFLGFPVSLRGLAASSLFTPLGKARMAAEALIPAREWDMDDDESIGSFVGRRFGREAVDYLAEPLLAGIHAGDVDALSVRLLFPRLVDTERQHGSLLRAFRALKPTPSARGAFVSLAGGVATLVEAVEARLPAGTVARGRRASRVGRDLTSNEYVIETASETRRARSVVLAVPSYEAAALIRDLDAHLAALCDGVGYASTATVALGYRAEQVAHAMRGTGFVVPRAEDRALLAATWVTSKWPGRAPEGHVLLRAFFGGGRDPERLTRHDDAGLIQLATEELGAVLGISGDAVLTRVSRWMRQSPQYVVGHAARIRSIEARLAGHDGLFGAGSGFGAIGIPDCIASGRAVAARVHDWLGPVEGHGLRATGSRLPASGSRPE
jgi:oxygen-dependent protoporphyrinogen oxidase